MEWGKLMIIINKCIRFWCLFVVECPTKSFSFILGMYSQNAGSHVWCVYLCCIMVKAIENICNIITQIIIRTTDYEGKSKARDQN